MSEQMGKGGRAAACAYLVLRGAALLVPRARRRDWVREWAAELDAWRRAGRPLMVSAMGAWPHATWLMWEEWTMRVDDLARELRLGARALARRPLFTSTAVVTLALGLGATVAVFSVVHAVLLRPLPYPGSDRVVVVGEPTDNGGLLHNTSFATAADWRERSRSFTHFAMFGAWSPTLTGRGDPEQVAGMKVSWDYFDALGVHPTLGRDFRPGDDHATTRHEVILSDGLWRRRFGADTSVVGTTVELGGADFTAVGVMGPDFEPLVSSYYGQAAEMWAPLGYEPNDPFACRTCRHLHVVARLKTGVTLAQARSDLAGVGVGLYREHPHDYAVAGAVVEPLHDVIAGPVRAPLWLLLGAVAFVLLIACANLASLLLARASGRRREMALRTALGAARGHLLGQGLAEALLLCATGGALGLALGAWWTRLLVRFAPTTVPGLDRVRMDGAVVAVAVVLALFTAVLFGLAPVLHGMRVDPGEAIKEGGRGSDGPDRHRIRSLLVAADVAVAMVLLVGVGLTLRSFVHVLAVDPGFDSQGVLTMEVDAVGPAYGKDPAVLAFHREVLRRVRGLPGVLDAGLSSEVPLGGNYDRAGLSVEDHPTADPALQPDAERYIVAGDYLRVMGIHLLRGRLLGPSDDEHAPLVALVDETLAHRFWPDGDALGKRIRIGGSDSPWRTIVGVVGGVRHYRLEEPPTMQVYLPDAQDISSYLVLVVRASENAGDVLAAVRHEVKAVDASIPVTRATSMDAMVSTATEQRRFILGLLGVFAGVALLLTVVGIHGLLAYHVTQRTREIGIRVALGARRGDVSRLVVGEGMALASGGVALGLGGALAFTRFLAGMLFGVTPTDPLTLAGVSLLMLGVAFAACWAPARRATRVDAPVVLSMQ